MILPYKKTTIAETTIKRKCFRNTPLKNKKVAKQGGEVAGNARKELEQKTGKKVVSADNYLQLPEKEKLVVVLYYYENLTLREIGEILDVSESRVCQIHTKVVTRMRAGLLKKGGAAALEMSA